MDPSIGIWDHTIIPKMNRFREFHTMDVINGEVFYIFPKIIKKGKELHYSKLLKICWSNHGETHHDLKRSHATVRTLEKGNSLFCVCTVAHALRSKLSLNGPVRFFFHTRPFWATVLRRKREYISSVYSFTLYAFHNNTIEILIRKKSLKHNLKFPL